MGSDKIVEGPYCCLSHSRDPALLLHAVIGDRRRSGEGSRTGADGLMGPATRTGAGRGTNHFGDRDLNQPTEGW